MAQQVSPANPLQCRSLEKWKRVFQDELDMAENEEFLVLKTSMCGWWYAVNKKQEDGLIPYMHLEILSDYVDYTEITGHEFAHIEQTVFGWDCDNICKLIFQDQKSTTKEQNILLHSLRSLYVMTQKTDHRYTFLSKGGLDRLHDILKNTYDIAIRTFCLRCMILLAPSIEARRFPAQQNLTEGILGVMKEYMDMPSFVCICTDALSNVAFQNERQRMLASKTNAVEMLLYAMDRHQTVFKVQLQASRSLANMASDPKIQRQIDEKGVQTILSSLNVTFGKSAVNDSLQRQHAEDRNAQHGNEQNAYSPRNAQNRGQGGAMFDAKKGQFAQQMLVIISYLTADARKAQTFSKLGGWSCLKTIQHSIGVWDENVRATIVGMLNSMSQNTVIIKTFFDRDYQGIDVLFDLCLNTEPYSLFFYQMFSIIAMVCCKCDKQQLPLMICRAFQQKQLAKLMNDALQQSDNERLLDTVPTICAVTVRTKDAQAMRFIYQSMVPMHMLKICGSNNGPPNDQFLNYTLMTVYGLTHDEERVDPFIQNGVIEAIAGGNWYADEYKEEGITQNGIAALINICAKTKRKLLPQQEKLIETMIRECHRVHPNLKQHIQKLEAALKKAKSAGSGKRKTRNPRNKKKGNKLGKDPKGGAVIHGAYNPQTGSYDGHQNARKPAHYGQQQLHQQQNSNDPHRNLRGPVQSAMVERPFHDENLNGSYSSSHHSNSNSHSLRGQQRMGGNGMYQHQHQQGSYGSNGSYGAQNNCNLNGNGNGNVNGSGNGNGGYGNAPSPYQSQRNHGGNGVHSNNAMNGSSYRSQSHFNGGNEQQNSYNNNHHRGNGYNQNMNRNENMNQNMNQFQSQNNYNINNHPQNAYHQQSQHRFDSNSNQQQRYGGVQGGDQYGNSKWETDSDGDDDASSSEDELEKEKRAKINAVSQVSSANLFGNKNHQNTMNQGGGGWSAQNAHYQQQQMPMKQGYNAPHQYPVNMQQSQVNMHPNYGGPQQGFAQQSGSAVHPANSAWHSDSSGDEDHGGWDAVAPQPPQQQQQQIRGQQHPSGMSKKSIADFTNHASAAQPRDYMGFSQIQNKPPGGYQSQFQQQQQQQQQQSQNANRGGSSQKKKGKFKLFK